MGRRLTVTFLVGAIVDDAASFRRLSVFHPRFYGGFAGLACYGVDLFACVAVAIAIAASTAAARSIIESVSVFL